MAKRNGSSKGARFEGEINLSDPNELAAQKPIEVIHDRLNQAHATLDLLYTMTTIGECSDEHIDTLSSGTLSNAVNGVMLRIEEAIRAAKQLEATHE